MWETVTMLILGNTVCLGAMSLKTFGLYYLLKEHICGGVILDAITILSAAHCFYGSGELEMHQGKTGKEFANLEKFSVFADIIYNNGSAGQVKKN